ncbi:MAG: nucleotide exchange factor GrpE [Deltaproteobacteria bacterium]|nr:nucleotide exchange factor GrpE [Deltaproteobacteria bacterium]
MSAADPERRRQLLGAVASWLEELETAEPMPQGVAPEVIQSAELAPDLFSLLSQLTALTRETQLQGRATNRLHTELSATLDKLAENLTSPETVARRLSEARREARLEVITELLEVRDRFTRGVSEAQRRLTALRGLWARFAQRPVLAALIEGNMLACERFDDLLRRLDVREVPCLGKLFDPTVMQAAEVVQTATAPPGTVIEVFRPGYTSNGRVLRFAEVKVATGVPTGNQPSAVSRQPGNDK